MTTEPEDDLAAALEVVNALMWRGIDQLPVPSAPMTPESIKADLLKLYGYDPDTVTVERDAVEPNCVNITLPAPPLLWVTFQAAAKDGNPD